MNFLLVSATLSEIRPLLVQLQLVNQPKHHVSTYHCGDTVIDVLIPGVGMVETAYFLGRQLSQKQYDLAVNAGIAGTFNRSLSLGTVVNVVEDCIPELGAEDGDDFRSVFELGLTAPDTPPYQNGRLINDCIESGIITHLEIISKLPHVKAITSNTVRGNIDSIARIKRISAADIESMEGAAFFYACFSENVPCLQIRSISNRVEERNKENWNIDLALKNLNQVLWEMVSSIPEKVDKF